MIQKNQGKIKCEKSQEKGTCRETESSKTHFKRLSQHCVNIRDEITGFVGAIRCTFKQITWPYPNGSLLLLTQHPYQEIVFVQLIRIFFL